MAKITAPVLLYPWVTINQPGAADAPAEAWLEAGGGGLSFEFAENVVTGYSTVFTGRHRYDALVLTGNGLPATARQWLTDLYAGYPAKRDVLVEYRDQHGVVKSAKRYLGAAIVAYQGPELAGNSKELLRETIEFVFASAEVVSD